MDLGFYLSKLREEHRIVLPLCLLWTTDDVMRHMPDGSAETEQSCMHILEEALVENEEQIIELINSILIEHINKLYNNEQ